MRMMMEVSIPVEAGNEAARTGALGASLQKILERMKPEAAYFFAVRDGERGGFIVFDMQDTSQMPAFAEPFFLKFNAKVKFTPAMTPADLAKAGPAIESAVKAYSK